MGNFFALLNSEDPDAPSLFARGVAAARRLKRAEPHGVCQTTWAQVVSLPRENGSGAPVLQSPNGDWLCVVGTWFHDAGFGAGNEAKLLQRLAQVGALQTARELSGFFVIVYGAGQTQETFVITDLIGSRHAFLRELPAGCALASSSMLLAALAPVTPDALATEEFIRTGVIYEDRSLYREVRKLAPASVYRFVHGHLAEQHCYWRLADLQPAALDGDAAVEALSASIVQAAQAVGRVAPRLLCDLTGGYDSRILAAACLSAGIDFETTVTGRPTSPDVIVAQQLAGITGKPHHPVELNAPADFAKVEAALALTDGEYDCVEYGLGVLPVHRRTASQYDLSANGSFGEVARGYWWELLLPRTGAREPLDARKVAAGRYVVDPNHPQLFESAATARLVEHFTQIIQRANRELADAPNTLQMDNTYLTLRMQRWQGRIASATDQIRPCLSPLMFRSVLESMLQATPRIRQRSLLVRRMLKQLQPRLAAHPLEHGYPAEPFGVGNFYRFAPLLTSYGAKAWNKGLRILGWQRTAAASAQQEPVRMQLWRDPAVRALLQPATMRLQQVLDPQRLQQFMSDAQQPQFPYEQQWARCLSLELAWRAVELSYQGTEDVHEFGRFDLLQSGATNSASAQNR